MTSRLHDVAVVGLGPVGATLALAICGNGLDVVALDARRPGERARGDRSLALSYGARLILERAGVWDALRGIEGALTPITAVDVSQAGGFGATRLTAADQGIEALGYVASYVALQDVLDRALAGSDVDVRFGVDAASVEGTFEAARVATSGADAVRARLAVVADGAGTTVAGIERTRHDYGQVALIASVWLDRPHDGTAYERFTHDGPMALLPQRDHYGLVWTMRPQEAETMLALDERAFLSALAARFGARVEGFTRVEARRTFPLHLREP